MKIETKIAKNGTKMYYVREHGKLTRISHDKAKEVNMNNLIAGLGDHVGSVSTASDATCILCVTVKDEFSNGDFGHGMYFDTADNAINAARTIATHDNFICAYVMGNAKHFHNARLFTINADKTEEFTDAYCQFKSAETANVEVVIETKITSNNNIVVKLNGKRVSADEAKNAILGRDYQINPVKIIDGLGEVFIGGTDSGNTVYVFEWERCGQVFEIPFGTNPIQLIARRDLADYRETPAPDKPAPKPDSPCAIANGLNGVFQNVVRRISYMDVTTQSGAKIATCFGNAYIEPDWQSDDGYVFTNGIDTFARYDTPEQVIDVITALSNAIKRGETQFCFPTVNQLAEPATADEAVTTEPAAESATAKFIAGQCYRNMDWSTFGHGGKVYKVTKRTAKYVYIATYSEYYGKWVGGYDKETDRYFVRENDGSEYVEYWDGERICAKFNDEQITKPAIGRVQIEDSLTRAMETALEYYKGFCHIGNLTAAENELKLYNICRKATSELWKE